MADGCALDESPRSSATTRSAVKPRRKIPCFPLPNVVGPAMRAVGRGLSAGRTSSTRTHLAGPGAPAHREEELLGMSRVPDEIAVRGDGLLDPAAWQEPFAPLDASTCDEFHLSIGQSESFVGEGSPQPSPFSWLSEEQDHRSTADEGTQSTSSLSLSSCSESEAACRLAEPTQDVDAAVPSVCAALGDEVPVLGTDSDVGISATSSSAMGTIPAYPLPPTSSQPEMETREAQPQAPVVKICVVEQPFQPGRSAAAPKRLSPMPVAAHGCRLRHDLSDLAFVAMARKLNELVIGAASICLLATHSLVSSRGFAVGRAQAPSSSRSLRSPRDGGSQLYFEAFRSPGNASSSEHVTGWTSLLAIAAAFGLVVGVTSSPVRAEDVASKQSAIDELKKSVEADVGSAATPNQLMATKAIKVNAKTKGAGKNSSGSEGGSPASVVSPSGNEAHRPAVLNPSDDVDDDERGFDEWTVRNPGLFLFFALIPTFIYLFFWVAGSLEIL